MKKILISNIKSFYLLLLVWFSFDAQAAEWVKYGSDGNGDNFYVDIESIKINDNIVIFSGLRDLAQPEKNFGSLSGTGKFKVDCGEKRTMLLAYNFFSLNMGKGELITAIPIRVKEWFYPPKNSIGNKQIKFLCNFNKQT